MTKHQKIGMWLSLLTMSIVALSIRAFNLYDKQTRVDKANVQAFLSGRSDVLDGYDMH